MDRRKDSIPKKSPSGSVKSTSRSSLPEYNVNVPCFPSPLFSSHSHVRHVLPQIPTRAGHPRMAVSKASTRDPFMGRMFEDESFADVITTHKLDDTLEQTHVMTKEHHDEPEFFDIHRLESRKPSSSGVKHTSLSAEQCDDTSVDVKRRKPVLDEDVASAELSFTHPSSPSDMLNIGEITQKSLMPKSSAASKFVGLGQKESKEFSALIGNLESGRSLKQSKQSSSMGPVLDVHSVHSQSRYPAKFRNPGKSSLFPMFDDSDSDDNGNRESPVAINLSLAAKPPLHSAAAESLRKFPSTRHRAVNHDNFGGSPLDAILKMTHMIDTSKDQSLSFDTNADTVIPAGSFPQQFSTSVSTFQPRDAWSEGARIFGSGSSPGPSYGKIAAEGMLKLPVKDSALAESSDVMSVSNLSEHTSRTTDTPWDSSDLQLTGQPSHEKSHEDTMHSQVCGGSPIKLKIRRGTRGDNSQLSIVTSKPLKEAKSEDLMIKSSESPTLHHPSPLALSLLGVSPSPGAAASAGTKSKVTAAAGRAKTKGELKKQLFERKEQRLRADGSQASSPAGSTMTPSPSHSHADTLSPLTVNVDGGLSTPQPSPQLSSGKMAVTSPAADVSIVSSFLIIHWLCLSRKRKALVWCLSVCSMITVAGAAIHQLIMMGKSQPEGSVHRTNRLYKD